MAKYTDMEVLSDIKIDKVNQTSLTLKTGSKISLQIPDVTADSVGVRVENGQLQFGDGTSWVDAPVPNQEIAVEGEPIVFSSSDLDSEGKLTIQHNLGKYPFGLDYSIMPKDIVFQDMNTVVFDYSDRSTITSGHVWFNGSQQSMLYKQDTSRLTVVFTGGGITPVAGDDYILVDPNATGDDRVWKSESCNCQIRKDGSYWILDNAAGIGETYFTEAFSEVHHPEPFGTTNWRAGAFHETNVPFYIVLYGTEITDDVQPSNADYL